MAKNPLDAYKNTEKFQSLLSSRDADNPAVSLLKNEEAGQFKPVDLTGGKAFVSKDYRGGKNKGAEKKFEVTPISVEKITVEPPKKEKESVYRRVAKFLFLIGSDQASKILPLLPKEDMEKIVAEIATIREVPSDEAGSILGEFAHLAKQTPLTGGVDTAKAILQKAFGDDRANDIIERHTARTGPDPFEEIANFNEEDLFTVLRNEPISVKSLVIARLKPNLAATILKRLPGEEKIEIVRRMAKLESIDSRVLKRMGNAILQKITTISDARSNSLDGKGILSEILRRLPADSEEVVLQQLQIIAPEIEDDLRARLFVLDDIVGVADDFIQKHLEPMDDIKVAFLIAGKNDVFREKILSNLSKNRRKAVLEEEIIRKPMRKKDVDAQTAEFFDLVRRAWEAGEIKIAGRDDDDEWIM